jgi:threonine dehydratase
MMPQLPVELADVQDAEQRIRRYLSPTPLYEATSLTAFAGRSVFAKLECMNPTGGFKVRGAFNTLLSLTPEQRRAGVVAASGGSHGLGIAYAAATLGVTADIFLPNDWASPAKIPKTKRLRPRLHMVGQTYYEAHDAALDYAQRHGLRYIHAFADPEVIAGQGTIGLEIISQLPKVTTVVVPVGGGGLISGIAVAVKSLKPEVRVVGVETAAIPALSQSLADGVWHERYPIVPSLAGGLAGGIGRDALNLAESGWIDDVLAMSEPAIRKALVWIISKEQWLIEGPAALSAAAVLDGQVEGNGPVCCVLTGANIAAEKLLRVLRESLD